MILIKHENITFQEMPSSIGQEIAKINKKYYHIHKNTRTNRISINLWSEKAGGHLLEFKPRNSFRDAISFVKQLIKKENQKIYKVSKYHNGNSSFTIRIFVNGNTDYIGQ